MLTSAHTPRLPELSYHNRTPPVLADGRERESRARQPRAQVRRVGKPLEAMASSSRSLLRRLAPSLYGRLGQSHHHRKLLCSAALKEPSPSPAAAQDEGVHITESCIRRMKELQANQESNKAKMLRLSVETGGCSGFQYVFGLEDKRNQDDRIFEKEGVKLVVDNISYDFVKGATVDYVEELIRSAFLVTTNPSAVGGCSCKSSFMVKELP